MSDLSHGVSQGLHLVVSGDHQVVSMTVNSLRIAIEATAIGAAIGGPLGCLLGLGDFRGRRGLLAVVNASVRLPPVAIGTILWLLMFEHSRWGGGPLAGLHWLYTANAAVLAQALLVLPIVAALTASAVQAVPTALLAQARTFGASPAQVALLAVREARIGVMAALIAAFGVAISTIGALILVGGSLTRDLLAPGVLLEWTMGGYAEATAYGVVLLGLFLILAAGLTVVQQRRTPWLGIRPS